jgi:hypothetical protein
VLEILDQRLTNIARQWQAALAMSLASLDENAALYPINIIQTQIDDFVGTQTQAHK